MALGEEVEVEVEEEEEEEGDVEVVSLEFRLMGRLTQLQVLCALDWITHVR